MNRQIRVLHVDDDPDFTSLAATLLQRADERLTVETADGPEEGLSALEEGSYHCVVSDYDMPERDGIEFLEAVRESHERLPFVLFTGKGSEAVASEAISAGVTDYLQKETGTDQFTVLANRIVNAVERDRAQRQLDVLIENLPGIVYQHRDEAEWPLTLIRGNCEELMGYTEEELQSDVHLAERAIHPEDRAYHNETLREELEEHGSYELTYRVLREDGDPRWVFDSGQRHDAPFSDGHLFSGILIDVDEMKQYERELETTRQRLEAILQNTTMPMFLKDADGAYVLANSAYRDLLGRAEGAVVGRTDADLHPPRTAATLERHDRAVLDGEEPVEREERIPVDGDERVFLTTRVPVYDIGTVADETEPVAVFGVGRDVTERVRRERQLRRQDDRLDDLAGVLSHDLQTPVEAVRSRLELALETGDLDHVETALQRLDRIGDLGEELATVLREGQLVSETERVSLARVAREAWTTLDPPHAASLQILFGEQADSTDDNDAATARAEGGTTDTGEKNPTETTGHVDADRDAVWRLFQNLLDNALTHAGPEVTVTVGPLTDGFYVADDGPGVDPAVRDSLFEPGVSQQDAATGHGMGLVSVDQIATAHGWSVDVAASADGGARFEITDVDTVE